MKNQIEILRELFREILGTISVEELTENGALAEMAKKLFKELNLDTREEKWA